MRLYFKVSLERDIGKQQVFSIDLEENNQVSVKMPGITLEFELNENAIELKVKRPEGNRFVFVYQTESTIDEFLSEPISWEIQGIVYVMQTSKTIFNVFLRGIIHYYEDHIKIVQQPTVLSKTPITFKKDNIEYSLGIRESSPNVYKLEMVAKVVMSGSIVIKSFDLRHDWYGLHFMHPDDVHSILLNKDQLLLDQRRQLSVSTYTTEIELICDYRSPTIKGSRSISWCSTDVKVSDNHIVFIKRKHYTGLFYIKIKSDRDWVFVGELTLTNHKLSVPFIYEGQGLYLKCIQNPNFSKKQIFQ